MSDLDRAQRSASPLPATLRADCARCVGLCCVADAFFTVQGFGYDKPARSACTHLTAENHCAIHANRGAQGFTACIGFDCYGAGQRVTGELGLTADWRAASAVSARAFSAYSTYLVLHRSMALLAMAESEVAAGRDAPLRAKRAELEALGDSAAARLGPVTLPRLESEVMEAIRTAFADPTK